MPAFDPVRDAVLNSPISSSLPLPSRMHVEMPQDTSTLPDLSPAPIVSPLLTRRATDLSVLLNDDPPPTTSQALDTPLFTPTTPRGPSGLSHLLLSSEPAPDLERDQLTSAPPLTRKAHKDEGPHAAGDRPSGQQASYFAYRESTSQAQGPRPEIKSEPIALSFPSQSPPRSPAVSTRQSPADPPPPPTPSDSHTASLASSSSRSSRVQKSTPSQQQQPSSSQPHSLPAMPPPATPLKHSLPPKPQSQTPPPPATGYRSARPYAPRRITPATSVLVPLSSAEIERYKHWKGAPGTMILRKKTRDEAGDLKRPREDEPAEGEERRKKRRAGDVGIVVEHCAYSAAASLESSH